MLRGFLEDFVRVGFCGTRLYDLYIPNKRRSAILKQKSTNTEVTEFMFDESYDKRDPEFYCSTGQNSLVNCNMVDRFPSLRTDYLFAKAMGYTGDQIEDSAGVMDGSDVQVGYGLKACTLLSNKIKQSYEISMYTLIPSPANFKYISFKNLFSLELYQSEDIVPVFKYLYLSLDFYSIIFKEKYLSKVVITKIVSICFAISIKFLDTYKIVEIS